MEQGFHEFSYGLGRFGLVLRRTRCDRPRTTRQIEVGYEITFVGMTGFRIDFTAKSTGNRYDVESHVFKEGILKALTMHYEGRNRAWGGFVPQGVQPSSGSLSLVVGGTAAHLARRVRAGRHGAARPSSRNGSRRRSR